VPLPADQAQDAVAGLHAGVREQPVIGLAAVPIAVAGDRVRALGADQSRLVGPVLLEAAFFGEALFKLLLPGRAEAAHALDDPAGPAVEARPAAVAVFSQSRRSMSGGGVINRALDVSLAKRSAPLVDSVEPIREPFARRRREPGKGTSRHV